MDRSQQRLVVRESVRLAEMCTDEQSVFHLMIKLNREYPGDIGVLSPLFLNLVQLEPGEAIYLPAPGVVGAKATRDVFLEDPFVREAMSLYNQITMALVGIGSVSPSNLLAQSGNIFSNEELNMLRKKKAVGDILLRFFDADGIPVASSLNDRVVSMELEQLKEVYRAIGIAGGSRKFAAIRGALRGRLINILITDSCTAEELVDDSKNRNQDQD